MPRKRTWHYLTRLPEGKWPERMLLLACDIKVVPLVGSKTATEDRLERWHLAEMTLRPEKDEISWHQSGESPTELWSILTRMLTRSKTTILLCHSAKRLVTLLGLWERLECKSWTFGTRQPRFGEEGSARDSERGRGFIVIDDPPTIIRIRPRGKRAWLEIRGMENYGIEQCGGQDEGACGIGSILRQAAELLRTLRDCSLGPPQATAASQAWHCFRQTHLRHPILVHADARALALERQSIHAGRNECYRYGRWNGPIYQLDATSHYSACCINAGIPCRLRAFGTGSKVDLERILSAGYHATAEVVISTTEPLYPYRRTNGTIFPVGQFRTVLACPELRLAIQRNAIVCVGRYVQHEADPILHEWAKNLFAARIGVSGRGSGEQCQFVKRVTVALYGRFAQRTWRWVNEPEAHCESAYCQWWAPLPDGAGSALLPGEVPAYSLDGSDNDKPAYTRWRSIGWHKEYQAPMVEPHDSMPCVAAAVYSMGRIKLLEWLQCAGWSNLCYCDTDSVWCNQAGYDRLGAAGHIREGELGYLNLKCIHDRIHIHGLKQVETESVLIAAGLPLKDRHLVNGDYQHYVSERMDSSLRRSKPPSTVRRLTSYRLGGKYTHGIVRPNGHVDPLGVFDATSKELASDAT